MPRHVCNQQAGPACLLKRKSFYMKKMALAASILAMSFTAFSQDNPADSHELGLVFNNLNSFGIRYKCGNGQTMFRLTSVVFTGSAYGRKRHQAFAIDYPGNQQQGNQKPARNTTQAIGLDNFSCEVPTFGVLRIDGHLVISLGNDIGRYPVD